MVKPIPNSDRVEYFLTWLEVHCQTREDAYFKAPSFRHHHDPKQNSSKGINQAKYHLQGPKQPTSSYAAFVSQTGSDQGWVGGESTDGEMPQQPDQPCIFCNGQEHVSDQCMEITQDAIGAFNIIDEMRACKSCLSPKHKIGSCPQPQTCKTCGRSHNSVLHLTPVQLQTIRSKRQGTQDSSE